MREDQGRKHLAAERAKVLRALAHGTRVLIVDELTKGERNVNELTALAGKDISTVSKHLQVMKAAGLVNVEKRGLNQFYYLACPCYMELFRCVDLIHSNHAGIKAGDTP